MRHEIAFNSQRDNFSFGGRLSGNVQCFSTCSWMFMSFYSPAIKGDDDAALAVYVDDVEATVGKAGIAEKIKARLKYITGNTSYWWAVQQAGINKWLHEQGVQGEAVFSDAATPFGQLPRLIEQGPVIIGTKGLGGLRGGHIILAVGHEGDSIIVHDPFGNARQQYRDKDGAYRQYPASWLRQYTGGMVRGMWWR